MRVRADGTGLETISDTGQIETFSSFSPDGSHVAFIEWFPNAAGEAAANAEIITVDIETGQRTRLTNNDNFDAYPYWGPSGEWIYYTRLRRQDDGRWNGEVYRISPDAERSERVTPEDETTDLRGIPTADETSIVYNNGQDGSVWIMHAPIAPETSTPE
ncbi:MAG: hypothetical protein RLN72_04260 [Henriciella sp.]